MNPSIASFARPLAFSLVLATAFAAACCSRTGLDAPSTSSASSSGSILASAGDALDGGGLGGSVSESSDGGTSHAAQSCTIPTNPIMTDSGPSDCSSVSPPGRCADDFCCDAGEYLLTCAPVPVGTPYVQPPDSLNCGGCGSFFGQNLVGFCCCPCQ